MLEVRTAATARDSRIRRRARAVGASPLAENTVPETVYGIEQAVTLPTDKTIPSGNVKRR